MDLSRRKFLTAAASSASYGLLAPLLAAEERHSQAKTDDLLEEIERRACLFFYEQADPATGLVKIARAIPVRIHTQYPASPPWDSA